MEKDNENKKDNSSIIPFADKDILSVFEDDSDLAFIYKKTERICAALYVVTNLFPSAESLKSRIRDLSSGLLSLILSLNGKFFVAGKESPLSAKKRITEILSLCGIANVSGTMSDMNYAVLKRELESLMELLKSKEKSESENILKFSESLFDVKKEDSSAEFRAVTENAGDKRKEFETRHSIKDDVFYNKKITLKDVLDSREQREASGKIQDAQPKNIKDKDEEGEREKKKAIEIKKNKRIGVIINILKKKKEITVKDISSLVSDCSEKTLQRELLALVEDGVLKKEGERRWSKYSLA